MNKTENKFNIGFVLLLALNLIALVMPKILDFGAVYGVSTLVWLLAMLYITRTAQSKGQLTAAAVVFAVGLIIRFSGLTGSVVVDSVILGICSIGIFFLFVLNRILTAKWNSFLTTLIFPILWMLGYTVMTIIRIPSVMRIDIMFFDFKAILQAETVIHSYGLSFAILWIVSLVVYSIISRRISGYIVGSVCVAAMVIFGSVSLASAQNPGAYVNVAYTTGPYVGDFMNYVTLEYDELEKSFNESVASAAKTGAHILVFNEEAFEIEDIYEDKFMENAGLLARENDMNILVGFDISDTDDSEGGKSVNKIVWIGSDGEILGDYTKYQIIPILESDYVRGDGRIPSFDIDVDGQTVKVSFAICYDSNFPHYIRQMDDETDILFLPSWDWDSITSLHYRICGTISVDNGVTLIKPTYDGYTIATDPYGRIIELSHTADTGFGTVQTVSLPTKWR